MKLITLLLPLLLLLLLLLQPVQGEKKLALNSNGHYEHLLVRVKDESLLTPALVSNMRFTLRQLAAYLHAATCKVGRCLSVASARLVVPSGRASALTAAGLTLHPATWELQQTEDLRLIRKTGGEEEAVDSVGQPFGCGQPGHIIRMDADMFWNDPIDKNGVVHPRGYLYNSRRLLHLFARYRYGVYSEHTDRRVYFDPSSKEIRLATCARNLSVTLKNRTSNPSIPECLDSRTEDMKPNCWIEFPNGAGHACNLFNEAQLTEFCDSADSSSVPHNPHLENSQNRQCERRSAGEVMRGHSDFNGPNAVYQEPELILVEANVRRHVVLVLDVSGSMLLENRLANLKTASTRYVNYFLETGAQCTVVSFSTTSKTLLSRTVNSQEDRDALAQAIDSLVADGWTDIAGAIMHAMNELGASQPYSKNQTGFVVLFSDGEHNIGPVSLSTAIGYAASTSIVFDTITLSSAADPNMAKLANSTGGLNFFSPSDQVVTVELDIAFATLAKRVNAEQRTNMLLASSFELPMEPKLVFVDDSITHTLHFLVTLPNRDVTQFNVTVVDPNGDWYGAHSGPDIYVVNRNASSVQVKIPDANIIVGNWTIRVDETSSNVSRRRRSAENSPMARHRRSTQTADGSVSVVAGTGGSNVTFDVDAFMRYSVIDRVQTNSVQKIYAEVTQSGKMVTGAKVKAKITSSYGWNLELEMKDDGTGADVLPNDGYYTCQILPERLTQTGEYSVIVELTHPISRTVSAGSFKVLAVASGSVKLPPGRVVDLRVVEKNWNENWVTLQFTATGDQADVGTPSHFELRASNSSALLSANFASCGLVSTLAGASAGSTVTVKLFVGNVSEIVDPREVFHVSVAAVSQAGERGQSAMSATIFLWRPLNLPVSSSAASASGTSAAPADGASEWTPEMVALVATESAFIVTVACAIVIILVAL